MFDEARFLQSTFSLVFPEQRDIVTLEKTLNVQLRPAYFPARLVAPESGDQDGPRLLFISQHGHSHILLSGSSATLTVMYSHDWQTRISDAHHYVIERSDLLFDILGVLDDTMPLYCGSVTRVRLPSSAPDEEIVNLVAQKFTSSFAPDPYHDVVVRITTVVDDVYFNNLTIQNYRAWNMAPVPINMLRFSRKQAVERGVEVIGDFNSRYGYNEDKEYTVNRDTRIDIVDRNLASLTDIVEQVRGGA